MIRACPWSLLLSLPWLQTRLNGVNCALSPQLILFDTGILTLWEIPFNVKMKCNHTANAIVLSHPSALGSK